MQTFQTFPVHHPKAIVLVVHGSGEHIGRYQHLATWLNKHNIIMVGGDLPGLGRSTAKRGHIGSFDEYINKVDQWTKYIQKTWPELPLFILGHSMGGLITLRYLQEMTEDVKIKGAIVTSPAVSIGVEVPSWQLIIAKMLVKVWPSFRMRSGIKPNQVSRDPKVALGYKEDPLVYDKVSLRWFFEFQKAISNVWEKIDEINKRNIPLLYLQAGADQLVDPKQADEFVKDINKIDLTYYHIPSLYHEILNEPEKETYLELVTDWLKSKF